MTPDPETDSVAPQPTLSREGVDPPRERDGFLVAGVRWWYCVLLFLVVAVTAGASWAHDDLVSASPGDGDTLTAVPDTLRLVFTRPQNLDLASVVLTGPGGELPLGEMSARADSGAVVLVPVRGTWTPGAHTVRWRIVGRDGHPVSGEYTFVVAEGAEGLAPPASADAESASRSDSAVPAEASGSADGASDFGVRSPLYVAVRGLLFGSLLGVLGAASYGLVVLPLARRREPAVRVAAGRRSAATVGGWAALLLVLATMARLWAQARALEGTGTVPDVGVLGSFLGSTVWGVGWTLQLAGALAALAAFGWARVRSGLRSDRRPAAVPWAFVGVAAVVLAFTPGLTGHAVGVEGVTALAVLADGAHILAAGGWMGGLLLVMIVALPAARKKRDPERTTLAPVVEAFSVSALTFAALLLGTGVFAAWLHLGSLETLWASAYGRTLGLKLLLLVPLFATGAWNWKRVRPALSRGDGGGDGEDGGAADLRRSGRAELAVAVLILLVTAVLVATPPPGDADVPEIAARTAPPPGVGSP